MGLHGAWADHQAPGYVVVAYSDRHQPQHPTSRSVSPAGRAVSASASSASAGRLLVSLDLR